MNDLPSDADLEHEAYQLSTEAPVLHLGADAASSWLRLLGYDLVHAFVPTGDQAYTRATHRRRRPARAHRDPPLGKGTAMSSCNAMFCIIGEHEGDGHTDYTGHSWTEPTPDRPVMAHVIDAVGTRFNVYGDGLAPLTDMPMPPHDYTRPTSPAR